MALLHVLPSDTLHRLRLIPPSASIRFPSKRTKRKNHLRPKILKTLTKPFTTAPLLEIVPVELTVSNPLPFLPENESFLDTASKEIQFENFLAGEADKLEEFQASEAINRGGVVSNISAKSVLKFCVCLVGVFMIQTIWRFWFAENSNSSKKEKRLIDLDGKGSILLNGRSNVAYFDGTEMEDKINEIRAMAKEARKREKTEREDDNEENDIEREIGARLSKLEKRLSSNREKLPESLMNYLGLFGSEEEDGVKDKNLELKEDKKNLMFRKNLRYGSPSIDSRTSPKGFSGSSDPISSNNIIGSVPNGQSVSETTEMEAMNKQTDGDNLKQEKVDLQKGSDSVTEPSRSKELETEVNQKAPRKPTGFASSSSSREKRRDFGKRPKANVKDKQADSWWLKLPYVLAILMRRGPENEAAGLYSLRTYNGADGGEESSYTVAFEDRGDANNFCYLLESYFDDLGDFRTDIVPLSTKDIQKEVKSRTKKIIVVKKGQLKLYAGQPFGEVEMALQSLIGED